MNRYTKMLLMNQHRRNMDETTMERSGTRQMDRDGYSYPVYPSNFGSVRQYGDYMEYPHMNYPYYGNMNMSYPDSPYMGKIGFETSPSVGVVSVSNMSGNSRNVDKMDEVTAKRWVSQMENADGSTGGHWNMEQTETVRRNNNFKCEPVEFYVVLNMMYSDYSKVAKECNCDNVEFYAKMAKAFLDDKDAGPGKLAKYYQYVVK